MNGRAKANRTKDTLYSMSAWVERVEWAVGRAAKGDFPRRPAAPRYLLSQRSGPKTS